MPVMHFVLFIGLLVDIHLVILLLYSLMLRFSYWSEKEIFLFCKWHCILLYFKLQISIMQAMATIDC